MKVSIGTIAKELGVSRDTLRRWEAQGKLIAERTPIVDSIPNDTFALVPMYHLELNRL
jgi:predicted site-specific integrase-resolvase